MSESDLDRYCAELRRVWYGLGGHMANRAWAALQFLEDAPQDLRIPLLRYLSENEEIWDTSEGEVPPPEHSFSDEEVQRELGPKYGSVLDALLNGEISSQPEETEFYAHLWDHVHNPFFSTDRTRAFALYWALIDDRVPYFTVGSGLRMSDKQYGERRMHHYQEIAKMRFLLRFDVSQRTEEASLLLGVIEGLSDRDDRVVLLAELIDLVDRRTRTTMDLVPGER